MRIDADYSAEHLLSDGTRVTVRPIRAADAAELRKAFEQLSPHSRYLRFLAPQRALSDEVVRYLTEVDGVNHVALVAATDSHDLKSEVGLGVGRFVRLDDAPDVAEVAVTVVDSAQRKGLGRILTQTLAEAALERGIRTFRAEVAAENEAMRGLLTEVGAVVVHEERGTIVFDVPLADDAATADESPLRRLLRAAAAFIAALRGEPPAAP